MKIKDIEDIETRKQKLINKMTNWQNHQWSRAGYPNDIEEIKKFTELKRGKNLA